MTTEQRRAERRTFYEPQLYHDHFQNFKSYNIPRAQLVIADVPYIGKCKRHAPSRGGIGSDYPLWPTVNHDDWCGDFARVIEKGGAE